jgi:hypothetical protein
MTRTRYRNGLTKEYRVKGTRPLTKVTRIPSPKTKPVKAQLQINYNMSCSLRQGKQQKISPRVNIRLLVKIIKKGG